MIIRKASQNERHRRPYSPTRLKVLSGPGDSYKKGDRWALADDHGFASVELLRDQSALHNDTMYIEHLEVSQGEMGMGHGGELLRKVEVFAANVGAEWLQIDSEADAAGFWHRMGFQETGEVFYAGKVSMAKKVQGT
jgi:predicted GNAT family N-acyltransferase